MQHSAALLMAWNGLFDHPLQRSARSHREFPANPAQKCPLWAPPPGGRLGEGQDGALELLSCRTSHGEWAARASLSTGLPSKACSLQEMLMWGGHCPHLQLGLKDLQKERESSQEGALAAPSRENGQREPGELHLQGDLPPSPWGGCSSHRGRAGIPTKSSRLLISHSRESPSASQRVEDPPSHIPLGRVGHLQP